MKRTIILNSSDSNEDLALYPITAWAWNRLGWDTMLFYRGKTSSLMEMYRTVRKEFEASRNSIITLPKIDGHSDGAVIAASKYFAGSCIADGRIAMTSPLHLVPIAPAWTPASDKVSAYSVFGHYQFAAPAPDWRTSMGIADKMGLDLEIKKLLDHLKSQGTPADAYVPEWLTDLNVKWNWLGSEAMADLKGATEEHRLETMMEYFKEPPGWLFKQSA